MGAGASAGVVLKGRLMGGGNQLQVQGVLLSPWGKTSCG